MNLNLARSVPLSVPTEKSPGYWRVVLGRVMRDPSALIVGAVIALLLVMALLGPWIVHGDPMPPPCLNV